VRAIDIIIKKRDHQELTRQEVEYFIAGYVNGDIPDYQASAWAMAITLNGMTLQETADLTMAIANSGTVLDLSAITPISVDKHSTGGVGDKTTLIVEPAVSACGLIVGKMSGRGLGFSGGTLDKMESVPGFRADLDTEEFLNQLAKVGLVLNGQTDDLAPADGKLYELRDVTGTVPSIPLIASSILSKKFAAGAQAIVLDVKVGSGAFMHTIEQANLLAKTMVQIANMVNRQAVALISDMNQPLGNAVGNAIEVIEAIETLQGNGPSDLREHCLEVASQMLVLGEKAPDERTAKHLVAEAIDEGRAMQMFRELVIAQSGDVRYVDEPDLMRGAALVESVLSPRSGYLKEINAGVVGEMAVLLGAGREKKGDPIDHAVGIEVHHKVGDLVQQDEPLFTLYANRTDNFEYIRQRILLAHKWDDKKVDPLPLFYGIVR